jgi:hypothetical protein
VREKSHPTADSFPINRILQGVRCQPRSMAIQRKSSKSIPTFSPSLTSSISRSRILPNVKDEPRRELARRVPDSN